MQVEMPAIWVGADPGGKDAFGIAILVEGSDLITKCVSCADEAVKLVTTRPSGVGVDAPLWWSSGQSGEREADRWIRNTYRIPVGTVQTALIRKQLHAHLADGTAPRSCLFKAKRSPMNISVTRPSRPQPRARDSVGDGSATSP
jgi:hypothetical protein